MISIITKIKKAFSKSFENKYEILGKDTNIKGSFIFLFEKETNKTYFLIRKKATKRVNDADHVFKLKEKIPCNFIDEKGKIFNLDSDTKDSARFFHERGYHFFIFNKKNLTSGKKELIICKSKDLKVWKVVGRDNLIKAPAVIVPSFERHGDKIMFYTNDEKSIGVARSSDYKRWKNIDERVLQSKRESFDKENIKLLATQETSSGILVIYQAEEIGKNEQIIKIGAFLVAKNHPAFVIWRSDSPIYENSFSNEEHPEMSYAGSYLDNHSVHLYFSTKNGEMVIIKFTKPFSNKHEREINKILLKKERKNPVIAPLSHNEWESVATFNPAAIYENGRIHLFYRAHGPNGMSVIGYASSEDGIHFDERSPEPVYIPRESFEGLHTPKEMKTNFYSSGYGWGGCEDPRITRVDDKIYMIYAAYNGWEQARLAMSYISYEDFLAKRWIWSRPELMSPRPTVWGTGNKNGALLPEKINGKYVVFHRIWPNISIDYVDDLKFASENKWLEPKEIIPPRKTMWDSSKIGIGAPPIKTEKGWLAIYQSVGKDGRYKIGAMLLDLNDPSKVLYRTRHPILEPNERYENEGLKGGVAYPCGAVIKDGELFVYYGGADTVVCVAKANLDDLLNMMIEDKHRKGEVVKLKII